MLIAEPPSNPGILKDLHILIVDNDRDSRDLYAFLLESHGAKVTKISSIGDASNFLDRCIPQLLICEMRFTGESVYPLIQQVRQLAFNSGNPLPVLVTSTCPLSSLARNLQVKVEAYLLKPINLDHFVSKVWNLTHLSRITCSASIQEWVAEQDIGGTLHCSYSAEVN